MRRHHAGPQSGTAAARNAFLNKEGRRKQIKRVTDKMIGFAHRAGVIFDPKEELPLVEDSTSTSGTATNQAKRKGDRLGRSRNTVAAKVVAGIPLEGESEPGPMPIVEAVRLLLNMGTLNAIIKVMQQITQTTGHEIAVRRLELVARAKVQDGPVDEPALADQILAVDAESAAQELEGVPDLSGKRKVPRRQQKKKNKQK